MSDLKRQEMEDLIAAERRGERRRKEKERGFMKSIRPVKVVGLDIPFGDVMSLTFKGFCASLIIAIPIVFIFLMIINS